MKVELQFISDNKEETISRLFIDGISYGYILEDQAQNKKVWGETRIPEGTYSLKLRTHGGFHKKYLKKFSFHEGMIEICNVPNFSDVLMHIGNDDDDTAG